MPYQMAVDEIMLFPRRNDNPSDKVIDGVHFINWRHGMASGPVRAVDWSKPPLIHDEMLRRCTPIRISQQQYDFIQQMNRPQSDVSPDRLDPSAPTTFRDANHRVLPTPVAVDYATLTAARVKDVDGNVRDAEADARGHILARPLDIRSFGLTPFVDIRTRTFEVRPRALDDFTISGGDHNFGTGQVYLVLGGSGGMWADVAAALTAALIGTQTSTVTETAAAQALASLAGYTWTTTSGSAHSGDPTAGWQLRINFVAATMLDLRQDNDGIMDLGHLRLQWIAAYNANNHMIWNPAGQITVASGTQYIYVHDIMGDGNDRTDMGINFGGNPVTAESYNTIMWDCIDRGIGAFPTGGPILLESGACYSCDSIGCGCAAGTGFGVTVRDFIAYNNGADFVNPSYHTGRYTRAGDTSNEDGDWNVGVGNTSNAVVENDVQSVDDTNSLFFDPKAAMPNGEDTTGQRTLCIRRRTPSATPTVGPAERFVGAPFTPAPERTFKVRPESRIFAVNAESRIFKVAPESRIYKV